ncbi:MAG: sigma-70 family RNA polymerase sigma factor, partial [Planctomycetota bacterium]
FRGYLKQAMIATVSRMVRQRQRAGTPTAVPPDAPEPSGLDEVWEQEYQQHLLREALRQVRFEVDPVTFQAFDLYALQEVPVSEVASFLGISRESVYQAKTRVTARLRAIVEEMDKS